MKRRILSLTLAVLMLVSVLAGGFPTLAAGAAPETPAALPAGAELVLHLGSPLVLANGEVTPLDSEHPGVVPQSEKGRTLVPLRAVAEFFGADVDYDAATRSAVIRTGGRTYMFPIGASYYTVGGERVALDVGTRAVEGRTLVPLRAVAEQVFHKTVSYYDKIITIGTASVDMKTDTASYALVKSKLAQALRPDTLEDVKKALGLTDAGKGEMSEPADDAVKEEAETPSAAPTADAAAESGAGDGGTTGTNVLVEGIDEADVIKTDGDYLYIAGNGRAAIVRAGGKAPETVAVLELPDDMQASELYVSDGRLTALGSAWRETTDADGMTAYGSWTDLAVYDISYPEEPVLLRTYSVEGSLSASRRVGDIVYLVTNYYIWYWDLPEDGEILPLLRDSAVSDAPRALPLSRVMLTPANETSGYTVVSAVNVKDAQVPASAESFICRTDAVYMNGDALYLAFNEYDWEGGSGVSTGIIALSVSGLDIGYRAGGSVPGSLLNQFSMDAGDGCFRVATTERNMDTWEPLNDLFVLNESLTVIGELRNIAPGEQLYSVRFAGERAYLVTFETTDPFFVVDLSEPTAPKMLGEVELPGFSTYLHPVSDRYVLGLGQNVQNLYIRNQSGKEIVVGTRTTGLKLTLFDVSDANAPKVADTYLMEASYAWSDALYDHRALMIDQAGGRFGFAVDYEPLESSEYFSGALLFQVAGGRITKLGELAAAEMANETAFDGANRLCMAKGTLYYVQGGQVRAFALPGLSSVGSLTLGN